MAITLLLPRWGRRRRRRFPFPAPLFRIYDRTEGPGFLKRGLGFFSFFFFLARRFYFSFGECRSTLRSRSFKKPFSSSSSTKKKRYWTFPRYRRAASSNAGDYSLFSSFIVRLSPAAFDIRRRRHRHRRPPQSPPSSVAMARFFRLSYSGIERKRRIERWGRWGVEGLPPSLLPIRRSRKPTERVFSFSP